MKIAFCYDWDPSDYFLMSWADGLSAALSELESRGHIIDIYVNGTFDHNVLTMLHEIYVTHDMVSAVKACNPDVILCWADLTRPNAEGLAQLGIPMAICFAGGDPHGPNLEFFDHIFVESKVYLDALKDRASVSVAFGTNTELFKPIEQVKAFDTIFPATFARWKRHQLYAEATEGLRSLAVGMIQPDVEAETWQTCLDHSVTMLPHVTAETLHYLYAASKVCVITSESVGGSQRTVLEAMAMNIPLIITDSDKFDYAVNQTVYVSSPSPNEIRGFIDTILSSEQETNTRDYIIANWSEYTYADALESGLQSIL